MKKIIILSLALFMLGSVFAQSEFDAVKFLDPDISGTARYTSMAGAFGALGGDPSSIKDNPAGLGIFRSSEISGSLGLNIQNSNSVWNTVKNQEGASKLLGNNLSYIISVASNSGKKTGLQRSNWAFNYNRVKNFNREVSVKGGNNATSSMTDYMSYFTDNISGNDLYKTTSYDPYNNVNVPWISVLAANAGVIKEYVDTQGNTQNWGSLLENGEKVTPSYILSEQGYLDQYSFSWSGNFSNRVFIGASLNLYDLYYRSDSEYKEIFGGGGNMSLYNVFKSESKGVGLKFGSIFVPVDFMRLGFSFQTPVAYTVNDIHYADLNYYYQASDQGVIQSPEGDNQYMLNTPLTYNLSAAFIMGNKGVVGIEYESVNGKDAYFSDMDNNAFKFRDENDTIKSSFYQHNMLKLGAELKLTNNISIRGGYAWSDPVTSETLTKMFIPNTIRTDTEYFIKKGTKYVTFGIGYRESNWYFDLSLVNKTYEELYYPYNSKNLNLAFSVNPAKISNSNLALNTTIGFKF
jgi:hypothetical protein